MKEDFAARENFATSSLAKTKQKIRIYGELLMQLAWHVTYSCMDALTWAGYVKMKHFYASDEHCPSDNVDPVSASLIKFRKLTDWKFHGADPLFKLLGKTKIFSGERGNEWAE